MKTIYLVTNIYTGEKTAHSSVMSFLKHPDCLQMSRQYFYHKYGPDNFPIKHGEFLIEKVRKFTTSESRKLETERRMI